VIKRAQPIADGNNPVCRLCIKEATAVVYALKDKKLLEQKERIYADVSAYQKFFAKVQLILNYNLNFN